MPDNEITTIVTNRERRREGVMVNRAKRGQMGTPERGNINVLQFLDPPSPSRKVCIDLMLAVTGFASDPARLRCWEQMPGHCIVCRRVLGEKPDRVAPFCYACEQGYADA